VAEPWSNDFAALDEHTRDQLRSLEATRAVLSTHTQETKMRFFKTHPALAALVALAVLTLVGGAAYAVVREVFVTIDPDKSGRRDRERRPHQLEAAGVPATVHAEKSDDGKLKVRTAPAIRPSAPTSRSRSRAGRPIPSSAGCASSSGSRASSTTSSASSSPPWHRARR